MSIEYAVAEICYEQARARRSLTQLPVWGVYSKAKKLVSVTFMTSENKHRLEEKMFRILLAKVGRGVQSLFKYSKTTRNS